VTEHAESPVVAIFGGSFNPPHVGHLLAATYVLACTPVDRVVVVPTYRHPFQKPLAPFDDRLAMCRHAFAGMANVEVSDVEKMLGGESLTVRTLEHFASVHPHWRMRLVIGADVLNELPTWTRPDRVRELAPPLPLARVGHVAPNDADTSPPVLPDVSSTTVRGLFAKAEWEQAQRLVPASVVAYARQHGLYR